MINRGKRPEGIIPPVFCVGPLYASGSPAAVRLS